MSQFPFSKIWFGILQNTLVWVSILNFEKLQKW